MSISSCLRKSLQVLSTEDTDLIKQITDEYVTGGDSMQVASRKAVDEVIGLALEDYTQFVRNIESRGSGIPVGDAVRFSPAWHGTPHNVDKFSTEKIGTGEGAQAYGWGLYFASAKEVAEWYRDALTPKGTVLFKGMDAKDLYPDLHPMARVFMVGVVEKSNGDLTKASGLLKERLESIPADAAGAEKKSGFYREAIEIIDSLSAEDVVVSKEQGRLYKVELAPAEDEYLLWDKPLSEQSEKVRDALRLNDPTTDFFEWYRKREDIAGEGFQWHQLNESQRNGQLRAYSKETGNDVPISLQLNISQLTGADFYDRLNRTESVNLWVKREADNGNYVPMEAGNSQQRASMYLHSLGIRGIKYLDGSSRGKGEGNYNYVIFSDEDVEITEQFNPRQDDGQSDTRTDGRDDPISTPPVRNDGRVELTHWSREQDLDQFDPGQHGRGAAGKESFRKRADRRNWVDRTYYGISPDREGGYIRERGLGNQKYTTSIDPRDLYDWTADSDGFAEQANKLPGYDLSVRERLIRDAGYKGFWIQHPQLGMVAAVFESLPVENQQEDAFFSPRQDDQPPTGKTPDGALFEEDPEASFEAPGEMSWKDKFFTNIVDKFHTLTKTQRIIGSVPESQDVDLAIVRNPGATRARIDDFELGVGQDLINAIDGAGLSFKQAAEFLHARHANEANAVLKKRNPDRKDNTALSGMTDAQAEEILAKYKDNEAVQKIGTLVDNIHHQRMTTLVSEGLLTQDEASAWQSLYKHYVPLHREEVGGSQLPARGRGYDIRGKESKFRAGSTKSVDYENMIAHIFAQEEATISRAEKNKVDVALYNLVTAHPNEGFWTTDEQMMPQEAFRKPDGTVGHRPAFSRPNSPVLGLKVNGEQKYIYFNEDNQHAAQILHAMKNMGAKKSGAIVSTLLKINRFLAMVNTSLSPEFVISNFFRDAQTAFYNLTDTEVEQLEGKILRSIPKSMAGIRSALRGDGSHEWSPWFDKFRRAGGMTGWAESYENIEERMVAIQRALTVEKHIGLRGVRNIFKAIGDYNTMVENAVRLSTFRHAVESGLSEGKAAKIAKEVTVNFNRRGEWAMVANAMYLFYNASVQGSARLLRAATNPKNKRIHRMLGATITFAAILDVVNRAATQGDDDDEKSKYDVIRERYGDRNLIIMDWFGITDDEEGIFLKIPLPWGYNVFHIMGQEIGGVISHSAGNYPEWKGWDATGRILGSTLESFNPTQDGSLLQTISPTIVDPFVRISENKDWHGGPLYPNYNKSAPNYTKFYANAREESRWIAQWLAETFQDPETLKIPEVVDVSPEWIDMGFDFVTGSLGRFAADTKGMTSKLINGEPWEYKEVPVLRKIIGNVAPSDIKTEYYDAFYEIKDMNSRLNSLKNEGRLDEYRDSVASVGDRMKLISMMKLTDSKMRKLKKQLHQAEKSGVQDRIDKVKEAQQRVMRQYLKVYRRVLYSGE